MVVAQAFFKEHPPTNFVSRGLVVFFTGLLLFATISFANTDKNPQTKTQTSPQLQILFKQGLDAANNRNYHAAIEYFRLMLKNNPNLLRPRLELARVLYKKGDYKSAQYHFEQVLSVPLPSGVRANINNFLQLIRQQLPSFDMSLSLSLNQKIPKKTKTSYLFGLPFERQYNNTGIRQHSYIFALNGKIPMIPAKKIFSKVGLQHTDIDGSNNAQTYLNAAVGKHFLLDNAGTITPEIGLHHFIYQDSKLYDGATFALRYFQPVNRSNYLNFTYNNQQFDYTQSRKISTGEQNKLTLAFINLPSISSRLDYSLTLLKSNAEDKSQAFEDIAVSLAYNRDVGSAWNIGVSLQQNRRKYQAAGAFDNGVKKRDETTTVELTLLNKLWQINDIAPKLYIGKNKNKSNIDVYGRSEPYIKLGFTQQF